MKSGQLQFDDQGIRLTPSHTKKGARRYRYYIHPIGTPTGDKPTLRVPAQELESAVTDALNDFLGDETRLMQLTDGVDADAVRSGLRSAKAMAGRLNLGSAADRLDVLKQLVARVTLAATSIEISVRIKSIWPNGELPTESATTSITVPMLLKRCGPAVRLIVRASYLGKARAPDPRLVALLAKAQRWFKKLSSGQSDSVLSIAQEQGLASSEVTRMVYLAFPAPDIVDRIVRSEHPIELNIKRLLAAAPLPMEWGEQRRVLGFDG